MKTDNVYTNSVILSHKIVGVAWSFRFTQQQAQLEQESTNGVIRPGRRFRKKHQKSFVKSQDTILDVSDNVQRDMTPVIIGSGPHLDIEEWLKRLDLEKYQGTIVRNV